MTRVILIRCRSAVKKLRAAAYCRVSTEKAEQAGSLSSQRLYFEQYIIRSDNMELVGVFYDEGTSGTTTMHRDGFNKMLKLARKGSISYLPRRSAVLRETRWIRSRSRGSLSKRVSG